MISESQDIPDPPAPPEDRIETVDPPWVKKPKCEHTMMRRRLFGLLPPRGCLNFDCENYGGWEPMPTPPPPQWWLDREEAGRQENLAEQKRIEHERYAKRDAPAQARRFHTEKELLSKILDTLEIIEENTRQSEWRGGPR